MRIERQIKEALLEGRFAPGDFLGSENDLATQFGVSRLPVREALSRLQALGVVDIKTGAGGGARIAQPNAAPPAEALAIQLKLMGSEAKEMFDAMEIIETSAIGIAAHAATEEDFVRMEESIGRMKELIDHPYEFTMASLDCHQVAVDAAQNHFLSSIMRAIVVTLYRSIRVYTTPAVARRVIQHHQALMEALHSHDETAAVRTVREHQKNIRTRYFAK